MARYKVTLTRTEQTDVFIEADSVDEAEEAAGEVESKYYEVDDDVSVREIEDFPSGEMYWTGGPAGGWRRA